MPNDYNMATELVPKEIENDHQAYRGLPNDYRERNGYSTEAAYRDGHREVDQERTEAIIGMTSTKKQSNETLPDAEPRDAGIRICKGAFREQKRAPIAGSMTTYWEAYMLDMDE